MTAKPGDIIDRDREWAALDKLYRRQRPELAFVLGRRRVGKSYVLSRFARAVKGIYFQATRRSGPEQLAALSRRLGEHFGDDALLAGGVLPSWETLFAYLTRKAAGRRLLLVLDEFTYLVDAVPELPSIIQHSWDHDWQGSRIRLVLSGSFISAMKQLTGAEQPLYGRRTARIAFPGFTAHDGADFVGPWSVRDKMLLYGTVGQLPGHLALVDPARQLGENLAELFLDPGGRLVDDAQHTLDAFLADANSYYAILAAVSTGDRTWSRLTSRVGKSGGSLLRPVQWLEQMEMLARVVPITERRPAKSKRAQYRITDPQIVFWHSIIAPILQAGSIGLADPMALWTSAVAPKLDDHMGEIFEQICRQWLAREKLPFAPVQLGSWWDAKSRNEVDLVAISADDELFVAECKWGAVTMSHLQTLRERAQLVAAERKSVTKVHLGLFTGSGVADRGVRAAERAGDVLVVGPETLV